MKPSSGVSRLLIYTLRLFVLTPKIPIPGRMVYSASGVDTVAKGGIALFLTVLN